MMNIRTLGILLRKEILLMKRNPFIPRIIIAMPLLVMLGEGNHNFILTVTDADGTVEEVTLKLKS